MYVQQRGSQHDKLLGRGCCILYEIRVRGPPRFLFVVFSSNNGRSPGHGWSKHSASHWCFWDKMTRSRTSQQSWSQGQFVNGVINTPSTSLFLIIIFLGWRGNYAIDSASDSHFSVVFIVGGEIAFRGSSVVVVFFKGHGACFNIPYSSIDVEEFCTY